MKITMRGADILADHALSREFNFLSNNNTKKHFGIRKLVCIKKFRANFTIKSSERVFESEGLIKVNLAKGMRRRKKKKKKNYRQ